MVVMVHFAMVFSGDLSWSRKTYCEIGTLKNGIGVNFFSLSFGKFSGCFSLCLWLGGATTMCLSIPSLLHSRWGKGQDGCKMVSLGVDRFHFFICTHECGSLMNAIGAIGDMIGMGLLKRVRWASFSHNVQD